MSDPVVIVASGDAPGGAEFASGVATATATQASQDAAEAVRVAELAQSEAEHAARTAARAADGVDGRIDGLVSTVATLVERVEAIEALAVTTAVVAGELAEELDPEPASDVDVVVSGDHNTVAADPPPASTPKRSRGGFWNSRL